MFNLLSRRQPQAQRQEPDPAHHPVLTPAAVNVPPTFIAYRHEPIHNKAHDPQTFGQYNVAENVELAPQPVPYTQWWNVGRDPAHAWPRMNLYQFMSPRDWLSVLAWPNGTVGHTQAGSFVTQPRGRFNPQIGRANINSPAQTSLGAQTAVQAPLTVDVNHLKLIY